jgi:predicted DNA-binding transcriptional regulator AlpA
MKVQLFSIEHAPGSLPIWHVMMDDLCNPPPARVARVLGISARSVYRYNATGQAPRAICLAVFWLTSWGRASVHAQAINDAQVAVGYVNALRSEVEQLRGQIAHVLSLGDFGSANDPAIGPPTRRPPNVRVR